MTCLCFSVVSCTNAVFRHVTRWRYLPGELDSMHGWLPRGNPIGQWMQLDLGSDKQVDGVVTQVRRQAILLVRWYAGAPREKER